LTGQRQVVIGALLSNGAESTSTVELDDNPVVPATNISVSPTKATVPVGSKAAVVALVTNQFGNPTSAGTPVSVSVVGGTLSAGGTSGSSVTDQQGRAAISVTSATAGSVSVTVTLKSGGAAPDCTALADPVSGAGAGNCTATTSVSFSGSVSAPVERPTLTATSPAKGKVALRAATHPKLAHAKVTFYRVAKGKHVSLGTAKANAAGVATLAVHLHAGGKYTVDAKVGGLGSAYTSKYSASHKVHVKK
jgi:hypothetical protein